MHGPYVRLCARCPPLLLSGELRPDAPFLEHLSGLRFSAESPRWRNGKQQIRTNVGLGAEMKSAVNLKCLILGGLVSTNIQPKSSFQR